MISPSPFLPVGIKQEMTLIVGTLFLLTRKTRKRWPVIRLLFLPPTKISTPKNKQTWSPSFKPKSKWATEKMKWENPTTLYHFLDVVSPYAMKVVDVLCPEP